jgi:dienelactone hydrolase
MRIISKGVSMRRRYKILTAVLVVTIVVLLGFVVWAETPPAPMQEALNALKSDSVVNVTNDKWLVFEPATDYSVGFIIYPGGRIDYRSYAPIAHSIAAEGYLTTVASMPLNLAVFGVNSANEIIAAYPNVSSWAIGGHSLGGTMAAQFVYDNPNKVEGLVLWAAYPASGTNLTKSGVLAVTIHGTNDGLVSENQMEESLKLLPVGTDRVELNGGNHAQFGWYGDQPGDKPATITREQQQNLTLNSTTQLLKNLKQGK